MLRYIFCTNIIAIIRCIIMHVCTIRYAHNTLYYYAYTFLIVFVSTVRDTDLLTHHGDLYYPTKMLFSLKKIIIIIHIFDIDICVNYFRQKEKKVSNPANEMIFI